MNTVEIEYKGNLSTECTHLKSGTKMTTDAPVDNKGKGESFSPTDLLATAYGSCMLTIVGIYCQERDISYTHAKVGVEKIMHSDPRRVGELKINLDFSGNRWTDEKLQKKIIRAAKTCPVAKSVKKKMTIILNFKF